MAYWKNKIVVEVKLPYITQGCTLDYLTAELTVTREDIWYSGYDRESRKWKAYIGYGDYLILLYGKAVNTPEHGDRPTTCKIEAWNTADGMERGCEKYKTKVRLYE